MKPTRLQSFLGVALLSSGVSLCQATPIVSILIDDFSVDQYQEVAGDNGCTTFDAANPGCAVVTAPGTQVSGTGILGGYRDVYIEKSGTSSPLLRSSLVIGPGNLGSNYMSISNDSSVQGEVTLVWDGAHQITADPGIDANIDTDGLGGIDFLSSSSNYGILLEVMSIDLNVIATLDLWDTTGERAGASHTFTSAADHVFQFSDFLSDNPSLDLHDIGAVRLTMNGPNKWDGEFNLVGVVSPSPLASSIPEPAPAALLGFALMLPGLRRSHRKTGR
ncbi:hypothetical protein MIN45_P1057 [Methylomarinovum tepidoasis]|uniref:PEP-CTERM protein-sorting domain-containing protein n=1 Tax=Methylomarinovum tepidoasis TaxID=2840183 RepID=A0AAU9CEP0_9GAMM|nr:hypothetical protein [Methylomarinovum sp. IN45]BCX88688.1 hypothetical protein MIN45_P1057 [Methylomarinovum sp. IN45]